MRLLELLREFDIETPLILSRNAQLTLACETDMKVADVEKLASFVHSNQNLGAACSSGSFRSMGMVVAPCSIKTMSEIATGATAHLIARAADVVLKEGRRLVLMLREAPFHLVISERWPRPPRREPSFIRRSRRSMPAPSLEQIVGYTLARVLDLFDIHVDVEGCWTGAMSRPNRVRSA